MKLLIFLQAVVVSDEFEILKKKLGEERGLRVIHGEIMGGRRLLKVSQRVEPFQYTCFHLFDSIHICLLVCQYYRS